MQDIVDAIVQVGILPVIIGYLLFDQSKKMEAMRTELVRITEKLDEIQDYISQCKK